MVQNLAYKINENPLRGFTFIQVSDSFSRTCHHVGDNVEIVCMSVQFPTLSQKVAKTILKRSLQDCREIVNRGVDLRYYTFQLFEYRTNFPTGIFRVVFFVTGDTVCTGKRLCADLKSKLSRYAEGRPFRIMLNPPSVDEYEGSLVYSSDNLQMAHSWLADFLWDTQACGRGLSCRP